MQKHQSQKSSTKDQEKQKEKAKARRERQFVSIAVSQDTSHANVPSLRAREKGRIGSLQPSGLSIILDSFPGSGVTGGQGTPKAKAKAIKAKAKAAIHISEA